MDVKGDVIVVKKGSDNWEVAKNAATKVTGDVKVGSKVTIEYTMTATKIEAKTRRRMPKRRSSDFNRRHMPLRLPAP